MARVQFDFNKLNAVYRPLMMDDTRHLVMVGGAGSGKSYFCADKCILRMISEPGHRVAVFRKVARTLKRSVWQLLIDRLSFWGLMQYCTTNKSDFTIRFQNGSEIWCLGLDDQEKLKSITGMSCAWLEEATECTPDDLTQVNLRMRGDTPGYKQILYSFNPISVMHHLKARFFDTHMDGCKTVRTTYQDNEFIDEEYRLELESLANVSENLYKVYALGQWGTLQGVIYDDFEYLDSYPEIFHTEAYGLDWGYNDPMALVHIGKLDDELYASELIYESGMTETDLIARMNEIGIPKHANIQCDEAYPDKIEQLVRSGWYNAKACPKGKGSLHTGIMFVQAQTIYTNHGNVNFNKEMQTYEWGTNRITGKPTDEPVDKNNHAMDAMRYAIWGTWGKPTVELKTIDRRKLGI